MEKNDNKFRFLHSLFKERELDSFRTSLQAVLSVIVFALYCEKNKEGSFQSPGNDISHVVHNFFKMHVYNSPVRNTSRLYKLLNCLL